MKHLVQRTAIVLGMLLLLLLIVPFLVPIPPLTDTVSARTLASKPSQFTILPFPGTAGLEIHYWDAGSGEPTFLLLHGFASNLYTWDEVFPYFAEQGRVVSYDRPAFGLSARPLPGDWQKQNPYAREAAVFQAITLLDELGINQVVLVGNSAGGALAMQIAAAHPERVDGLILAAPAVYTGNGTPPFVQFLAKTPQIQRLGPLLSRYIATIEFSDKLMPGQQQQAALGTKVERWDEALWEFTAASSQIDLPGQFDQLTMPILVIAGNEDNIVPTEESIQLAGELPDAELVVIPACGHTPQQECETAFLDAVNNWLVTLEASE